MLHVICPILRNGGHIQHLKDSFSLSPVCNISLQPHSRRRKTWHPVKYEALSTVQMCCLTALLLPVCMQISIDILLCKRRIWYCNKWNMKNELCLVACGIWWSSRDLTSSTVCSVNWSGIPACNPIWWETQNLRTSYWPSLKVCHCKLCNDTVFMLVWHVPAEQRITGNRQYTTVWPPHSW